MTLEIASAPFRMGIDIGSVSAKVVVLDPRSQVVFRDYCRHKAETQATLATSLQRAFRSLGNIAVRPMMTGSAGMGVAERYAMPFIQEVIASGEVVKQLYPQIRTLIDIGGEDSKLIYFDAHGAPDIRMNGSCAGGTGAYIDEMAGLLHVPVAELSALANQHSCIYPMASRCGVFGKTDVQNLLSREVPHPDIAASILHAVVLQTLATLARGLELQPLLLFSGGPLTFIPALRSAFMRELQLRPEDVLQAPHMELMPATGAALAVNGHTDTWPLAGLVEALTTLRRSSAPTNRRLQPLFESEAAWQRWQEARASHRVERVPLAQAAGQPCFLGLDSGSTTSKLVLVDQQGRALFTHYANNQGNAIQAAEEGLELLHQAFAGCPQPPIIARSAATGYGEDLVRAAFGFDDGLVETIAHYRAARAFDPQVSFILDIGGQDMKAIYVRNGTIVNIELNEACSSGCGTFIETFARSMGYGVADFAHMACTAPEPYDLGSRCTVFMNSRIKQALKDAAEVRDISAGLAYSVIKNALHKVLRITDPTVLGDHIVVQGGTFRNPAVQRALEIMLGQPVICPDMAELMGAYGAALAARDAWQESGRPASRFVGLDLLAEVSHYEKRLIHCRGCENRCTVTRLAFPNGGIFFTGNRCERIYTNHGDGFVKGTSVTSRKLALLFDRPLQPAGPPTLTIGVPRALNTYDDFPFWCTLLVGCGFAVRLSAPSTPDLAHKGAGTVMSENICFPAKLVHGHILDLVHQGVDRILYPMVFAERQAFADAANSYNCPIVTGYPDVIRSAIDPQGRYGIPLDMPAITFQDQELLRQACYAYLRPLGVRSRTFHHAFQAALQAQHAYRQAVVDEGAQILQQARAAGRHVILLLGRPYHHDPLINHGVTQALVDLGVDVITEDAVPREGELLLGNSTSLTQWEYVNRYYHAVRWASQQPDVEVVQLNSFACGPDAFTLDEVKSLLDSHGKGHTTLRIDEIESTGSTRLRLRSLVETLPAGATPPRQPRPRPQMKLYEVEDRHRTILIPHFSHFCAPIIAGPLLAMGYRIETLPPSDQESIEIGLRYAHNEICYPAIVVIGDLIKALQSGKYDLANVAVGSWQTGGQCRASNVLSQLKKAMIAAGYQDVPIRALTTNPRLHQQPGDDLSYRRYLVKALLAGLYADSISTMYYATAIRAPDRQPVLALADELLEPLNRGVLPLDRQSVMARLQEAVARFNQVATADRAYPRVGIVGEIYVKVNAFANKGVAQWLMDNGLEVVVPDFLTYFLGWFVNTEVRVQEHLARRNLAWAVGHLVEGRVQHVVDQADAIMAGFRYYTPRHSPRDLAATAREVMSLAHAYGENWLIAGEIGALVQDGTPNVLCLQPFGCIANQVVARGMARRLKEAYPGLNLLYLDVDAGLSEVNYFNRMHFFVSQARGTLSPALPWQPAAS